MGIRLKPLNEQTIVITGASSGIGLVTARMAGAAGARVVVSSRDQAALEKLVQEVINSGGHAVSVVADVSEERAVTHLAEVAVATYGGIDTWVNNAGVGIYGRAVDISLEDARRLMDINYFGVVHGSLAAVRAFRQQLARHSAEQQGYGMALINVGSAESHQALPLHSHYAASKQAVKGFTEALRMELEDEGLPISLTLVKPGAMDTPFVQHAKNLMEQEGSLPAPVYAPEVSAEAILHAATHPVRDLFAGGGGWMISRMGQIAPRFADRFMERVAMPQLRQDRRPEQQDALYAPGTHGGEARGIYSGHVCSSSLYNVTQRHPLFTTLALGALAAGVSGLLGTFGKLKR